MSARNMVPPLTLMVILTMFGLITLVTGWTRSPQVALTTKPAENLTTSSLKQSLTLLEAWEIFDSYGKQWNSDAVIAFIQSIDVPGDTQTAGQDGHRRGWMAVMVTQDASLWLSLVEGVIVNQSIQSLPNRLSALVKPTIDSPQALDLARTNKPEFDARRDRKGQGFHFALETSPTGSAEINVLGAVGKRPARIQLDPYTGQVLASQLYTYAPTGGILYSSDAGQHWQASNLQGKMITALARDPGQEGWAYAASAERENITIYQTKDGGATWEWLSNLPPQAGDWPFDLIAIRDQTNSLLLLVGTWNGLWLSTDRQDWLQVESLPQGPVQWLATSQSNGEQRLFATISYGEGRGLYSSSDISLWTKVADNVYRLSESYDQQLVIATSEDASSQSLLLSMQDEKIISMSDVVLHAAGDFQGAATILLHSPNAGSGVSEVPGGTARWTLPVPVASLAASPDFLTSHIAIAGGFRTGIYRTKDGGQTWEQVLSRASDILPGSDEVYEVVFLSPNAVIAVNGGKLDWQDF